MKNKINNRLRSHIFDRDGYVCALCNNDATDVHHLVPKSQGGDNTPQNLISLCRFHHKVLHREIYLPREMRDELEQNVIEYIADYYADENQRGFLEQLARDIFGIPN
jgi:5-methylcytosine-specific restriction endonuclease McrA